MTLNENKTYNIKAYSSKVSVLNTHPYKVRKTSGMLILAAPYAEKGMCYVDRVNDEGIITYTPLGEIPLDVFVKEKLHVCKALQSGGGVGLNARLAKPGAYYYTTVNGRGVITYTPADIANKKFRGLEECDD